MRVVKRNVNRTETRRVETFWRVSSKLRTSSSFHDDGRRDGVLYRSGRRERDRPSGDLDGREGEGDGFGEVVDSSGS